MTNRDNVRDEVLQRWQDGESATEIARAVASGLSRSAVMGIVHRARQSGAAIRRRMTGNVTTPRAAHLSSAAKQKPVRKTAVEVPEPDARQREDGSHIGMAGLGEKDCRWPHGKVGTAEFHYCGQAQTVGSPYCEYHTRRAWAGRPQPSKHW